MNQSTHFSYRAWVAAIERHQRSILFGSVVICMCAAFSLTKLRLDFDVLGMLPAGRPAFDDFKSFVADFGELNELVVLVQGAPLGRLQAFADGFGKRLAELDTVAAVHVRTDMAQVEAGVLGRYLYNYMPATAYAELAERLTPAGVNAQVEANRTILNAPFDLDAARAVAADPLGVRWFVAQALAESYTHLGTDSEGGYFTAPDGGALLVFVEPHESAFDISFSERLMDQVRSAEVATREALALRQVRVDYTGSYVYALEDAATLRWDIRRYALLAFAGVLTVFFLGYRDLRLLPYVAYPLLVTTLLTFSASLVMFDQLNAVSLSFAAILYGLSIDAGVHFYTRLYQERCQRDSREAIIATLTGLGRAHVTASSTSALVFLVIGFSCLGAVRQLGFLTAVGMMFNTLQFFTLYPALGFALVRQRSQGMRSLETPVLGRVARFSVSWAWCLVAAAGILGVVMIPGVRRVEVDVSLDNLRPGSSTAVRVEKEIAARFGSRKWSGAVLVRRPTLEAALIDGETVARQLARLKAEGEVQAFKSIEDLLPSTKVQQERLALYARLPRAAAVDWLQEALRAHGFALQPFSDFTESFRRPREEIVRYGNPLLEVFAPVLGRHIRARSDEYIVATYVQPATGVGLRQVAEGVRERLGDVSHTFASRPLLEAELGSVLRQEIVLFFVLALVGNFVLLRISTGSTAESLGVLLPAVLVVITLFEWMSASGVAVNPVNLIIIPLILGLSVDDGLYIAAGARERAGWPEAVLHGGRALVVTSLTTIAGFGFLGLSRFPALATLGLLAGIGLSLCLVSSIILVPSLMTVLSPRGERG